MIPTAVLLAEDTEGTLSLCDMHTGGRHSQALRGSAGTVACRGVARLGSDYVVAAYKEKPVLHVWTWLKHAQPTIRIPLPGKALAVACTPCGTYCLCGIGSSIYVWQIASGRLLAVVSHHFQPVSVLRFTDDGALFLSGGQDGHVHVWGLGSILSQCHRGEVPSPLKSWRDHSRPVTDIYCGTGAARARVFTTAKDGTCQVYELSTGQRLCTLIFESPLLALALDSMELYLFGAEEKGHLIRKVNMYRTTSGPQKAQSETSEDDQARQSPKMVCTGHTGSVTCLSLSPDGTTLLSASNDGTARLWQVSTCACLLVFERKGPVSFGCFTSLPGVLWNRQPGARVNTDYLPPLALFQRQLATTSGTSSSIAPLDNCPVRLHGQAQSKAGTKLALQGKERSDYWKTYWWSCCRANEKSKKEAGNTEAIKSSALVKQLQQELAEMRKLNRRLLRDEVRSVLSSLDQPQSASNNG
eukprot:scpid53196/ scgid32884/ WD repeat-containing protein 18